METGLFISLLARRHLLCLRRFRLRAERRQCWLREKSTALLFSPDSKLVAGYETRDNQTKIQIFNVQGGARVKAFNLAPHGTLNYWDYSMLHWTPDGRALTYPLLDGDAMNLATARVRRPSAATDSL